MASQKNLAPTAGHKVVAVQEHDLVVIGVDVRDRPGLLLEISKALASLRLNIRHTEASVVGQRSISIWRCELIDSDVVDLDAIWSVLNVSVDTYSRGVTLCIVFWSNVSKTHCFHPGSAGNRIWKLCGEGTRIASDSSHCS